MVNCCQLVVLDNGPLENNMNANSFYYNMDQSNSNNNIIMGCVSQNGCFGPRRREKQVYAQLVQSIFVESQKLQGSESISKKNSYNSIRDRINKKGLIRKLIDHLLSHKNKINDCLNYNLRLVSQSKTQQGRLAGLLIINQITVQIYKTSKVENIQEDRTVAKASSSHKRLIVQDTEMKIGADIRFDIAYFRLILQLIDNQRELISNVLNSIIMCCSGRKQKFGCKAEIWRVLEHLLKNLQKGLLKQLTAKCYLLLLQLLKQGGKEQNSHEGDLLIFFRLWEKQEDQQPDSASDQTYQMTIFKILRLFVNRCMSSWDSKVLFRSLFQLYEDENFPVERLIKLEGLIIGIIQQHDFHAHILRGLFLYLLEFLSATPTAEKNNRKSFNQEFQSQRFAHVYDRNIKLRLFETLRRWGECGYINLDQSVSFSSSTLVGAYISNFQGEREYVQQVVQEFFRLIKSLKWKSNLTIANLFLDQIRWPKTDQNIRRLLINLTRQLLETCKLLQKPITDFYRLLVPIDSNFSKQAKIQIIQLMGFIIKNLTLQQLLNETQQSNATIQSICQLLYSLYQGSKVLVSSTKYKNRQEDQLLSRYQYANTVLSFLKCFIQKYAYLYVLGFLGSIHDRLGTENTDKTVQYFQLYILYEGMHLINQKHKLPDKMISINFKISPSIKSNQVKQKIELFVSQIGGNGQLYPQLRKSIASDLKSLQQFTMIKQLDYKQMQQSFQYYFKPTKSQSHLSMSISKGQTSRNQFKRQSVNGSFYESCKQQSLNGEQNSFKDVIERIVQN